MKCCVCKTQLATNEFDGYFLCDDCFQKGLEIMLKPSHPIFKGGDCGRRVIRNHPPEQDPLFDNIIKAYEE